MPRWVFVIASNTLEAYRSNIYVKPIKLHQNNFALDCQDC